MKITIRRPGSLKDMVLVWFICFSIAAAWWIITLFI